MTDRPEWAKELQPKAADLKPGDVLAVCGLEWECFGEDTEKSGKWLRKPNNWSVWFSLDQIDTMLRNGATIRAKGEN